MSLIDAHFARLGERWKGSQLQRRTDGSFIVTVPKVSLPAGWNKNAVTVHFVVPIGYPVARPDCFWADSDILLAHGAQPSNTNINQGVPELASQKWFSFHPSTWNPNQDDLVTYTKLIQRRFRDVR